MKEQGLKFDSVTVKARTLKRTHSSEEEGEQPTEGDKTCESQMCP